MTDPHQRRSGRERNREAAQSSPDGPAGLEQAVRRLEVELRERRRHERKYVELYQAEQKARTQAEAAFKALAESELQFRRMGEAVPFGVWLAFTDGHLRYASPSFLELLDMSMEQLGRDGFADRLDPSERDLLLARWQRCLETGDDWEAEMHLRDRHGRPHTVLSRGRAVRDNNGAITSWCGINLDITDRREMERELKAALEAAQMHEARARLAAIVEQSEDAILGEDADGIITSWNGAAERLLGYTADEIIGRPFTVLIPEDHPTERKSIVSRLEEGQAFKHLETVRLCKDGSRVDVAVTISPIRDRDGRLIGASKIIRDITQRKQHEQELQAAKDLAEDASSAKDRFIAALSHELRTPLTPVLASISLLEGRDDLSAETRRELQMMRRNIQFEASLIEDLLDLTQIQRGRMQLHFEATDIHAIIRAVLGIFESDIARKHLQVVAHLDSRRYLVWADPARMQQVFWHLLKNAIKFTPPGGRICVGTESEDGIIRVSISDSGIGIDPATLSRVFQAFENSQPGMARQFSGLGLGLAVSRALVELHGGKLLARSAGRWQGATFLAELSTVPPVETPARDESQPRPLRILLVEDHGDTRSVLARLLQSLGYSVRPAGSVSAALELAAAEPFDLLISDIGLPDGTGRDVMSALRARGIRGIAVSGFGTPQDIQRSLDAGFSSHLTKPIDFNVLEETIAQIGQSVASR